MKLHFEPNLDFQQQAIEAVCNLFQGQEICRTEFTVTQQSRLSFLGDEIGIANRLSLLDDELLKNLRDVQRGNGLRESPSIDVRALNFTVEMETGTGKTYVYLRTIFELNKRYGFTKFIIVVPSIAIREGVLKTLQITEEHFRALYAGVPYDYFVYDSKKLGQVRNFATNATLQIMVMTVGAINKKDLVRFYKPNERTADEKPIDLVRQTRPVLIIDEPQSVDGGRDGEGKKALDAMEPLCTLRYSATHVNKHEMVYRLDAVDAYERKLVKQIEVASATVEDGHNRAFVRLLKVQAKPLKATIELDVQTAAGVRRTTCPVTDGDNLEQSSNGRPIYAEHRVGEIRSGRDAFMELRFPNGERLLRVGEAYGDVEALTVEREMIRRTIREHLNKERRLGPQGIKVLSLFFIDDVVKYRRRSPDGTVQKGPYATIFEEEYQRAAKLPEYNTLFKEVDLSRHAEDVHNGYFSIDRKGGWTSSNDENSQTGREDAERAYNLIMKDKEALLSLATPLKFIFSHSALGEGWDNPNVFQICTLRDITKEGERRQTIGRGLRICVNQVGERVRDRAVNVLTVIARESYEQFAEKLQQEIEVDTGFHFGIVEQHAFAAVRATDVAGETQLLGDAQSKALWESLRTAGFIDAKGKIQDALRKALAEGSFKCPPAFAAQEEQVVSILKKLAGRIEIKNADDGRSIRTRGVMLHSEEFRALWDRIKHKTTYRLSFDNAQLIQDCIEALRDGPAITRTRLQWRKADIAIGRPGVSAAERDGAATVTLDEGGFELPDLLTELQDRTQLTRRTIYRVLMESGRLSDFHRNPQQFITIAAEVIRRRKRLAIIDGIKYHRIGETEFYAQELFEEKELRGYLKNLLQTRKSVYEEVVYASETEKTFAQQLELHTNVKVYAKLPNWFKVPTPLGTYNPDWAVLVEEETGTRLYFVVETKSSLLADDLREREMAKIKCGEAHFAALRVGEAPATYVHVRSVGEMLDR